MVDHDHSGKAGFLVLMGVGIGLALGILFAPRPGQEIRQKLRARGERGRDALNQSARSWLDKGRDLVQRGRENIAASGAPSGPRADPSGSSNGESHGGGTN